MSDLECKQLLNPLQYSYDIHFFSELYGGESNEKTNKNKYDPVKEGVEMRITDPKIGSKRKFQRDSLFLLDNFDFPNLIEYKEITDDVKQMLNHGLALTDFIKNQSYQDPDAPLQYAPEMHMPKP